MYPDLTGAFRFSLNNMIELLERLNSHVMFEPLNLITQVQVVYDNTSIQCIQCGPQDQNCWETFLRSLSP